MLGTRARAQHVGRATSHQWTPRVGRCGPHIQWGPATTMPTPARSLWAANTHTEGEWASPTAGWVDRWARGAWGMVGGGVCGVVPTRLQVTCRQGGRDHRRLWQTETHVAAASASAIVYLRLWSSQNKSLCVWAKQASAGHLPTPTRYMAQGQDDDCSITCPLQLAFTALQVTGPAVHPLWECRDSGAHAADAKGNRKHEQGGYCTPMHTREDTLLAQHVPAYLRRVSGATQWPRPVVQPLLASPNPHVHMYAPPPPCQGPSRAPRTFFQCHG